MYKFCCKDTFYNLSGLAAERIIEQTDDCDFCCKAEDYHELMKLIVCHATEVHGLEDRRLAPAVLMDNVKAHIVKED